MKKPLAVQSYVQLENDVQLFSQLTHDQKNSVQAYIAENAARQMEDFYRGGLIMPKRNRGRPE